jgi:hypothetical protein
MLIDDQVDDQGFQARTVARRALKNPLPWLGGLAAIVVT